MKVARTVGVLLSVTIIGVVGQVTIITPLDNVAQYVGDNVKLVCEFQGSVSVLWYECITNAPPGCNGLYQDGNPITPATPPPPRYSVEHHPESPGTRYDLVITGVQTDDGGKFRCDNIATPNPAYADVIVLGSDMQCSDNLTSGSEVELGDFIYLSSDVTFHGSWAPVMRFRYHDNTVLTGLVDETSGVTAKYSVVLEAVKSLEGQTLSAEWYFDDVTGTAAGEATNTPTFPGSNTCNFQPITVFYPPEGLTIDPVHESYHVGETITCTAQGNPAPSIHWINMNDSSVAVNCAPVTEDAPVNNCQLVVSQDRLGTTATYRCRPCNNYFSRERCILQDITFTTYITTASSTTVPPTTDVTSTSDPNMACECEEDIPDGLFLSTGGLAGIIVVCVLLLLGNVILGILYWRKRGDGKNKDADSVSVERDVTSPSYQNIATYVNVSGGARGAGGATLVTQPGSEPYAELGPLRDPPRRAEYDVLRLPAASNTEHDVTHNYING